MVLESRYDQTSRCFFFSFNSFRSFLSPSTVSKDIMCIHQLVIGREKRLGSMCSIQCTAHFMAPKPHLTCTTCIIASRLHLPRRANARKGDASPLHTSELTNAIPCGIFTRNVSSSSWQNSINWKCSFYKVLPPLIWPKRSRGFRIWKLWMSVATMTTILRTTTTMMIADSRPFHYAGKGLEFGKSLSRLLYSEWGRTSDLNRRCSVVLSKTCGTSFWMEQNWNFQQIAQKILYNERRTPISRLRVLLLGLEDMPPLSEQEMQQSQTRVPEEIEAIKTIIFAFQELYFIGGAFGNAWQFYQENSLH